MAKKSSETVDSSNLGEESQSPYLETDKKHRKFFGSKGFRVAAIAAAASLALGGVFASGIALGQITAHVEGPAFSQPDRTGKDHLGKPGEPGHRGERSVERHSDVRHSEGSGQGFDFAPWQPHDHDVDGNDIPLQPMNSGSETTAPRA